MPKKQLQAINIDGIIGSGLSTQVEMLAMHFYNLGNVMEINTSKDDELPDLDGQLEAMKRRYDLWSNMAAPDINQPFFLVQENTFFKNYVTDRVNGMNHLLLENKYQHHFYQFKRFIHQFGTINIILVPKNIQMCHNRLIESGRIDGKPNQGIVDKDLQLERIQVFKNMNSIMCGTGIEFLIIEVREQDYILDIQKKILEYAKEKFDIAKHDK